jgi:hypothetical protein
VVPCSRGIPGEAIIAAAGALEIPSTAALTVVGVGADIGLELLGRRLAVGGQVRGIDRVRDHARRPVGPGSATGFIHCVMLLPCRPVALVGTELRCSRCAYVSAVTTFVPARSTSSA